MSGNRYIRRGRLIQEPKIGRMLLVSLGLHLLLFIIFSGGLVFTGERNQRPVYYVDLTQMPVANPQAGRPDARSKPVTKEVKKPAPEKIEKPAEKKPAQPVQKPVSKPQPEVVKRVDPAVSAVEFEKKLAAMKEKNERKALKEKLAALASGDSRDEDALASDAPLGMPDGQGDEAGVEQLVWLEAFIKSNWSLSTYALVRTDVEATAWVIYNKEGRLVDFSLQKASGEKVFDDSIKKAILKSKQLEFEPGFANQKISIIFNLRDLQDR
jgi:outer membrane biosynthesis protein TonB